MTEENGFGRVLMLAGGEHGRRGEGDPFFSTFLARTGLERPRVAYVGAASDDDQRYFSVIEPVLLASGAGEVFMASFSAKAPARKKVENADLIFISGGDVESGMANLEAAKAIPVLIELFKSGKPFAGVSAGSIMMSKAWVRWSDPDDDKTATLFPCLGFADFICDTHDEFDDWSELKIALAVAPEGSTGCGIPTGAGLFLARGAEPEAFGKPSAAFKSVKGKALRTPDLRPR